MGGRKTILMAMTVRDGLQYIEKHNLTRNDFVVMTSQTRLYEEIVGSRDRRIMLLNGYELDDEIMLQLRARKAKITSVDC
jgi:hypothetical protein